MNEPTVASIVNSGLCTGCGTCVALCPTSSIALHLDTTRGIYTPAVDMDGCRDCGTCIKVCPASSIARVIPTQPILGELAEDQLLGRHLSCHLSRAVDPQVRYHSASGGLVTSLLVHALDRGTIDGALVTRMSAARPLEPEPFVARTRPDILQAMGSKYCPVPANTALKEILEKEGRYAVVGLPCQIRGVRLACERSRLLRERIKMRLGLFCSHTLSAAGTDLLLKKLGIRKHEVASISYRGRAWPGGLTISLTNGKEHFIPNQDPLWNGIFGRFLFTPAPCLLCSDLADEEADLSFGDPWLPEVMKDETEGISIVIARTEEGLALLKAAEKSGTVETKPLESRDVVRSQRFFLDFKKVNLHWRIPWPRIWLWFRPPYRASDNRLGNAMLASMVQISAGIGRSRLGRHLAGLLPHGILHLWATSFYVVHSRTISRGHRVL